MDVRNAREIRILVFSKLTNDYIGYTLNDSSRIKTVHLLRKRMLAIAIVTNFLCFLFPTLVNRNRFVREKREHLKAIDGRIKFSLERIVCHYLLLTINHIRMYYIR